MDNNLSIRNNAKIKIYEVLFTNRTYSLLPYDRLQEILENIENVILLLTEDEFSKHQIREGKARLYNKFYMQNFTYVLDILKNNQNLITELSEGICNESIIYKRTLEKLVGEKTRNMIIKQNNKKNIKVKVTYLDEECPVCKAKTIKQHSYTFSIDEQDVIVKTCETCHNKLR